MYKKVIEKIAAAGTVALLGYEVGSNMKHEQSNENHQTETKEVIVNNNSEIVTYGIVILLVLILIIAAKLFMKKRQIV